MRLAVYGKPESYTKKDIIIEMEYYIEHGVNIFDFLSYGDFEIMVAQVLREIKSTSYPDIYSILYPTDRNIEYNKDLFDMWASFSSEFDIQDFIDEVLNESDYIYPQKLDF